MAIGHSVHNGIAIVTVEGFINHTNAVQFEEYVSSLAKEFSAIIIDAAKMEYVSSTGIGALIYAQRVVEMSGGTVVLCNCNNEVRTILNLVKLSMKRLDTLKEALESCKGVVAHTPPKKDLPTEKQIEDIISSSKSMPVELPEERTHVLVTFDKPLVIECPDCGAMVKVTSSGKFRCPDCSLQFTVDDDRTIYFN